jgi:hypothetical protein
MSNSSYSPYDYFLDPSYQKDKKQDNHPDLNESDEKNHRSTGSF